MISVTEAHSEMWSAALHSVVFVGGERSIYMGVVCHPWVFNSIWKSIQCSYQTRDPSCTFFIELPMLMNIGSNPHVDRI